MQITGRAPWAYQNVLKENRVVNKFDNFLHFLLGKLNRKYAKSVGYSISQQIKLDRDFLPVTLLGLDLLQVYVPSTGNK